VIKVCSAPGFERATIRIGTTGILDDAVFCVFAHCRDVCGVEVEKWDARRLTATMT